MILDTEASPNRANEKRVPSFATMMERLAANHVEKLKALHEIKFTTLQEKENLEHEISEILKELLDVLDSFDQMIENIASALNKEDKKARRVLRNFQSIRKKFGVLLNKFKVTPITAESGEFIAGMHNVADIEHSDSIPGGHILRVERQGFFWKSRILRPSEVVVADSEQKTESD